jgi:hypothetical protein
MKDFEKAWIQGRSFQPVLIEGREGKETSGSIAEETALSM